MTAYQEPRKFNPPSNLTAWQWYSRYLNWMKKHNDPALAISNYHADKLKESLRGQAF